MKFEKRVLLMVLIQLSVISVSISQSNSNISVDDAFVLIQDHELDPNFIILDVRTKAEYDTKHIENGVNLDFYLTNFSDILDSLIKDKLYLVHCASGGRSLSVYLLMQEMGFEEVYNMTGGINTWVSEGYEITTEVLPILLSVSETSFVFSDMEFNQIDSVEITITNYGNDTLDILNVTELEGTEFSSNFDVDVKITGLDDYTFKIYYSPQDDLQDTLRFQVVSEYGTLDYELVGNGTSVGLTEINKTNVSIFPNPCKGILNVKCDEALRLDLVDLKGQTIFSEYYNRGHHIINFSKQMNGVYLIVITTKNQRIVKKLILE